MSKFEKKFGKYALNNLPLMLIMCYGAGYIVQLINADFLMFLTLNPYEILHGQIWRLFTWILVPPDHFDLFTIIMLYFYYTVGNSLEHTWGTYRFNVYIFLGLFLTVLGSFLAFGLGYAFYGEFLAEPESAREAFGFVSGYFSTYYVNMSIFLAFAATFPRAKVLLMLLIPVEIRWMGIVYGVLLGLQLLSGTGYAFDNIFYRTALIASLLNFLIFWLMSRNKIHMTPRQMKQRQEFKREVRVNSKITKHKCAVCGKTDEVEGVEFRFCSKCNGNYEYCQDHLFTHKHVE